MSWRTNQNIRPPSSLGTHIRFRLLTRKKNQSFTFIPCEEVSSLYWVPWRRWRQLRWRFQAYPHGLWFLSITPEPPLFRTVLLASFFVIVLSLLLAYFSGCAIWIKLFSFVFHPFLVFLIYYCLCNVSGTFVAFKPRFYKTTKRKLWWKSLLKLRLFLVKDLFWRSRIRVLVLWRLRLSSSSKESMSSLLYVFKWHTIPPLDYPPVSLTNFCFGFHQDSVIKILDTLYRDRTYPRFFVLETIARVPYFGKCMHPFVVVSFYHHSCKWGTAPSIH